MADIKLHFKNESGKYKCNYCGHYLAPTTSTKRLRAHLIGAPNVGTKICLNIPDDVRISLSLCDINKRQKTATGYIVPSPSNLPLVETENMTEATTTLVLPPNGSGANNYFGNQGPLRFLPQQHTMPLQYVAHLPLGETSEGTIGLTEAVMPPNETSSNPHQIESGANNHYIPSFSPKLINDFGNQGGVFQYMMSTHPNESGSDEKSENKGQENQLTEGEIDDLLRDIYLSTHPNESATVENLLLPNVTNFQAGEPSEVVIGWTTQPVERGSTHQPDPLTTTDLLPPNKSCTRATTPPNESCGNLEPEASPPTDLVTQDLRNCCLTVEADQHGVGDAEMVQQEVQMVEGNREGEGSTFRTKRLVGEDFVKNEGKIWSWLMDDQVLRVGIYGMGGVGKTTLMRHIQTLLEGQSSFEVYWVTVSQDFSIWKLQNLIAKQIGLNFLDEEDEVKRAKMLAQAMQAKGKCVLILDDLWNYFDVEDAGIPVKAGGCKLVLTTRLLDVCQKMDCNEGNIIQVQALSRREAWILFTKELGNYSTEVEQLAKFVAIECDGLPLGIRVMARAMKGIREVHRWRNALEELRESKLNEGHKMREEVFPVLKFSYLHLTDPALRKCLLYCALFPEDHKIDRGALIEYMIVEGIIDAKKSRRAEWDRGHTMLDTLVNVCLLEGNTRCVWMHDLVRDMAIYELRERSNTLVEAGAQLNELPDLEEWTENLVCVSLMYNDIEVIPFRHTPRCPDLSTLLLCANDGLREIAGSFLKQFQKLKVLDLSGCKKIKELSVDVSDLVNLTALLLRECRNLSHVPSLVKLERLKKLDLSHCGQLNWMPEGVESLINLKHLDLSFSGIKRIGNKIVHKLSRLQVLNLVITGVSGKGKELGRLKKLERLECNFYDTKEWRKYLKSREKSQQSLNRYFYVIGGVIYGWSEGLALCIGEDLRSRRVVWLKGGSSSNDYVALPLPTDIQALIIDNDLNGSLWDSVLALKLTTQLHFLHLDRCDGIACLVNAPWDNLCGLSEVEKGIATTPFLSNLISIQIRQCHKLKNLYPAHLLPNLQKIKVWYCSGMEEIFGTDQEGKQVGLNLPQLITLVLDSLPELRSIYNGAIICHSLQQIEVVNCPKLERITLPLPQPSLWRIKVFPAEWWESVQWGSANDKIHLQSLAGFMYSYC